MAALTGTYDNSPASSNGELVVPVKALAVLYPGGGVVMEAGFAVPARLGTGLTTVGALKSVKTIVGAATDGAPAVVETSYGGMGLRTYAYDNDPGAGAVTQATLPVAVFWLDDHTVTRTATGASRAGTAFSLDPDGRVRIAFDQ